MPAQTAKMIVLASMRQSAPPMPPGSSAPHALIQGHIQGSMATGTAPQTACQGTMSWRESAPSAHSLMHSHAPRGGYCSPVLPTVMLFACLVPLIMVMTHVHSVSTPPSPSTMQTGPTPLQHPMGQTPYALGDALMATGPSPSHSHQALGLYGSVCRPLPGVGMTSLHYEYILRYIFFC